MAEPDERQPQLELPPSTGDSLASSAENSDRDGDTFEDAIDSSTPPRLSAPSRTGSSRSLTGSRSPSVSNAVPRSQNSTPPPLPTESGSEHEIALDGVAERDARQAKSPPRVTAEKISAASLDDISLEEADADTASGRSRSSTIRSRESPRPPPIPRKESPRISTASLQGTRVMSAALASMSKAPQAPNLQHPQMASAPPPSRKLTSPFSWLSRNTSATPKPVPSNPQSATSSPQDLHERQMSIASVSGNTSTASTNPDLMLSRFNETGESETLSQDAPQRFSGNTLRDRFKLLRIKEEAGITSLGDDGSGSPVAGSAIAGLIGRSTGLGVGIVSPTSVAAESNSSPLTGKSPVAEGPPSARPMAVNPHLAPGTVSGITAGPSAMHDPAAPVDWDLWQSVVYEGPAAVARTSPDELNRAIASGIPSAIRGVVWQVLAHSKNEGLESVYRDLVNRGTSKDKDRSSGSSQSAANTVTNGNGSMKETEEVISSSSSVLSDQSTPVTNAGNGHPSPTSQSTQESESTSRTHSRILADSKRRAAEDPAALQKLEKTIKKDLGARTSYSKYVASAGLQDGLFGVCKAYALYDEGVGYAQGMNFLIMPLLFLMPEEETFCLLVRLMNQYHLRDMFIRDMPGLHLHLFQFERLLEDLEPALYCHLHRRGVHPQLYATQWFLTLFAYRFPLQLVLRIYDLVLTEGLEGAILKFGIILMQKNAHTLLEMDDMAALTTFLKERLFDVYIDQAPSATSILESGFFGSSGGSDKEVYRADVMVQDACAVKITATMLKTYTTEWEEKIRLEKEREAEIESLKTANSSLSVKIRSLEERAEKSDTEHVQMASELVRTKVENEELLERNESLQGQVEELRLLVERQPVEVEERLKDEMDRIMKRNLEVHNENRALEDGMTEMEKDLVETKMRYAEINSAHETLKQKWNDLRKALGN